MKTVYLVRHSKPLKVDNTLNRDSLQIQNEKSSLSIDGEKIAQEKFNSDEFSNIDVLYSSNYVRAIQTAKYIADKNNIEINIVSDFGERKHGIRSWSELPNDFELKQFNDENYKIGNGESQKEVRERMYNALINVLEDNKRIAIVSHATAIMYLLGIWCNISYDGNSTFNGKIFFDGKWDYCESFKLVLDDNNSLISIVNI